VGLVSKNFKCTFTENFGSKWKFIESGERMYIQTIVLKKNTSREEDKICSYLLLEKRSHGCLRRGKYGAWQQLPHKHTSQLHKGQGASQASNRQAWLVAWHESLYLAILHRQKKKSASVSHLPAP
jgi:hypothetical protein